MIIPLLLLVVDKLKALGLKFTIINLVFTIAMDVMNCFQRVFDVINTTEASAFHPKKSAQELFD